MSFRTWDVYRVAQDVAREACAVAAGWPRGWSELVDQARRASTSVILNIAEGAGQPRGSAAKRRHYEIALGSANEVAGAIDAAVAIGLTRDRDGVALREQCARLSALLGGLVKSATSSAG